jgi:hypothetical protein
MHDCTKPTQKFIQHGSYSSPKTTEHRCAPVAASLLPQTFLAIFRKVYLKEVVGVDVFPLPHMNYLIKNSLANTHNVYIILVVVVPVLHHPSCFDL